MLSILLPVYNKDCTSLVIVLSRQAQALGIDHEIVMAEDGSEHVTDYAALGIPNLRHIVRTEHHGRSAMRNFLFDEACYPLLLMMDCDVSIVATDFVERYLLAAQTHDVVCGGIVYPDTCPSPQCHLRYDYEKHYERRFTARRLGKMQQPPFRSSCFLIHKKVADTVHFDERFQTYGYEDVLFGKALRQVGFRVHYIDNPVLNTQVENDDVYWGKVQQSLSTLAEFRDDLRSESSLLRLAERIASQSFLVCLLSAVRFFCWTTVARFQWRRLSYLVSILR